MVGLSDIPCVGKFVDRISDATVDATIRGLRYLFCYKALVDELNSEIDKLHIQEVRMSKKAVEDRADGKIIYDHVLKWHTEREELDKRAKEFAEIYENRQSWRCIQCLPIPNPVSRFTLGNEALHMTKKITQLYDSGKELLENEIGYVPAAENVRKTDSAFQNFQSREDVYGKLWEALVTEGSARILGIYGMPGVGKTRIMEQLCEEAKEKTVFDNVVRVDVGSEKFDATKLQNQIAGQLNCHFDWQDNVERRASQLKSSFQNKGKSLVILDDVWEEIDLTTIGINFNDGTSSNSCKILMTSRDKEVCLHNNCEYHVRVTPLTSHEAWDLFSNTVGTNKIDSLQDETLPKKVCNKCAGLPLVIHAVGKALKFKQHYSWKDALDQLENCKIQSISGIKAEVYACLKLSFDNLPEDAKSCLLLCSLFAEDANIYIWQLFKLATESQLVQGGKARVRAMVEILTSSSLLLENQYYEAFKIHDIIRYVARSIAVTDAQYAFCFARCGSWLPDNYAAYGTSKLLHLELEKNDFRFPDDLLCPGLHTLYLRSVEFPGMSLSSLETSYIKKLTVSMFGNLRFLVLENFSMWLQFSLQQLDKLKILFLQDCNIRCIGDTDVSFPECLETLLIWNCHFPVPLDLTNLKHLRKLEIRGSREKVRMVATAISSLSNLEELHIPYGFIIWHDKLQDEIDEFRQSPDYDTYRHLEEYFIGGPIIHEVSKLTRLRSLNISFGVIEANASQDAHIFCNLVEFDVLVGIPDIRFILNSQVPTTRSIALHGCNCNLRSMGILLERAEEVVLGSIHDVNISSICSSNREAFEDLRNLYIDHCNNIEYLVRISPNEIQYTHQMWKSFSNLTILEIKRCSTIEYLFCKSVAKCLARLQELCITFCPVLEAIVMNQVKSDGDIINFSKLKSLTLKHLPRLRSFYSVKKDGHFSSTSTVDNSAIPSDQIKPLFGHMVAFPSLEEVHIEYLEDLSDIWGKHYYNDNASSFCKLKSLKVYECNKLKTVVSLAMLHRLRNLEHLDIQECNSLRNVFLPSVARDLVHLKEMFVEDCNTMREIIGVDEEEITVGIVEFPELTSLSLNKLPNLASLWCSPRGKDSTYKVNFPYFADFVLSCGKVNLEEIELGTDDSTCQLTSLFISCDDEIQIPRTWRLRLHNLERLTLRHCWWHELESPCFRRLEVLEVYESGCSTLFSISVFRSLQQLQKLVIQNCDLLENIVEDVKDDELCGTDETTITLLQLKTVFLVNLPNLKSFMHNATYECQMPLLNVVEVENCGLSTIFTCSVFKNLQQLDYLRVSECEFLEEIVEDERCDETSDTNDKIITLSQLESISLINMPNLKSFSGTANYVFSMPKLLYFNMFRCPKMEIFTPLKTSTASVLISSEWHDGKWLPDLNDYIRQNFGRASNYSESAEESSYTCQELETEPSERVEEEQPQ